MAKAEKSKGGKIMKNIFAPYYEIDNTPYFIKIGGTTYEVKTYFNTQGRENVLKQFKDLITELNLV